MLADGKHAAEVINIVVRDHAPFVGRVVRKTINHKLGYQFCMPRLIPMPINYQN